MIDQKPVFFGLCIALWAVFGLSFIYDIDGAFPYVALLGLLVLAIVGEMGAYPFEGRGTLVHIPAFLVYLAGLAVFLNAAVNLPAPRWYPTDDAAWIVLAWLAYGLWWVWTGYRIKTVADR